MTSIEINQAVQHRPQSHDECQIHAGGRHPNIAILENPSPPGLHPYEKQPNQAAENMHTVRADQRIEQSPVDAARSSQTEMNQPNPFITLNDQKQRSQ